VDKLWIKDNLYAISASDMQRECIHRSFHHISIQQQCVTSSRKLTSYCAACKPLQFQFAFHPSIEILIPMTHSHEISAKLWRRFILRLYADAIH